MRSALVSACVVSFCAATAFAAAQGVDGDAQWCPGQPWQLSWGVNWDERHCHSTVKPGEANPDLDGGAAFDPNPPSDYPPGQYPPNYNWGEHAPYNGNPYSKSPYRGQHN